MTDIIGTDEDSNDTATANLAKLVDQSLEDDSDDDSNNKVDNKASEKSSTSEFQIHFQSQQMYQIHKL